MASFRLPRDLLIGLAIALPVGLIGTLGTLHVDRAADERSVDALAIVCVVVGALALTLWRRAGIAMLALVAAALGTYLVLDYPRGPALMAGPIAVFLAALTQRRAVAWAGGAGVAAVFITASWIGAGELTEIAGGGLIWPFIAVLAGQLVAARRQQRVADREQQRLRQEHAREAERLRLAQDLHDSVAHAMATINVQAGVAAHLMGKDPSAVDPAQVRGALEAIRSASGEALDELTSILAVLRHDDRGPSADADRRPMGDLTRIDDLVTRAVADGLRVDLRRDAIHVSPQVAETITRVVQEALANVLRHAGPGTAVTVTVARENGATVVSVVDDGGGTPTMQSHEGAGLGLVGMRERVTATDGSLIAEPGSDGGFRVIARWPAA